MPMSCACLGVGSIMAIVSVWLTGFHMYKNEQQAAVVCY